MASITSPDANKRRDEFNRKLVTRRKLVFEIMPKVGFSAILGGYTLLSGVDLASRYGPKVMQAIMTSQQKDQPLSQSTAVPTKVAQYVEPDVPVYIHDLATDFGTDLVKELGDPMDWSVNDIKFAEKTYPGIVAEEIIKFANEAKELLPKDKKRLTQLAQITNISNTKPTPPTKEMVKNPENSTLLPKDKFTSGHFGEKELFNFEHSRLTRMNLATAIAISIIENGQGSELYRRLIGEGEFSKAHWDAFNAHVGRDAGRFFTGITDSQTFTYGSDSPGGIFATDKMVRSADINNRLQIMLQPLILAMRCKRYTPPEETKITNFEVNDKNGNPNYELLASYPAYGMQKVWMDRFKGAYKAIQEFCRKHPEYNWLLTESIV